MKSKRPRSSSRTSNDDLGRARVRVKKPVGKKMKEISCTTKREKGGPDSNPHKTFGADISIFSHKNIETDYVLGDEIGRGGFGTVLSSRRKSDGLEFAIKKLSKWDSNGEDSTTVLHEVDIMKHLGHHDAILGLEAVYADWSSFYLVLEFCSGDLSRYIEKVDGPFPELQSAYLLKWLMLAIKHCHDMGVVHRDVKPDNILFTSSGTLKLADFGLATRISKSQSLWEFVGSPEYLAPELLATAYSEKVDIRSAGVILHTLLVGVLPFRGDLVDDVFEEIEKVSLDFNGGMWEFVSEPARDLVGRMLTRDVSSRPAADEVLSHPWILLHTSPIKPKRRLSTQSTTVCSSNVKANNLCPAF